MHHEHTCQSVYQVVDNKNRSTDDIQLFCVSQEGNGKVSLSMNYIFTPASNAKGRHRCQYCRIHLESATSQSAKRQLLHYFTLHLQDITVGLYVILHFHLKEGITLLIDNYSIT